MKHDYPALPAAGISIFCLRRPDLLADPNAFIPFVFSQNGKSFIQSSLHVELQNFLTRHRRALVELPRDHGKTTQLCGRILWELARNPRLRVKVVCATDAVAIERGQFLRTQIESNPRLRCLCPHLKPARPWSIDAMAVVRPGGDLGPSIAAFGIGSGSTGTRADLLICDDIVDVKAMHGRADRERVKRDFENNLLNLLEPEGRFWGLCTPWHRDDLNAQLKSNASFALFRRPIDAALSPIWPEKWPRDALQARRGEIGHAAFARGYHLLSVSEEERAIEPGWVRYWQPPAPGFESVVLSIDPAVSSRSSADATGMVVLGKAAGVVYCLAAKAYRVKLPELLPLIDQLDRQWNPTAICFESNAAFQGIFDLLARDRQFGHKLKGSPSSVSKSFRVEAFSVRVQRGEFLLAGDGCGEGGTVVRDQRELYDEMTMFPFGEHDDLVDAAAAGTEYLLNEREARVW
ncbi:MAG: hypothetical protein U0798_15895 [Gemmataceae bacterium]